MTKMVKKEPCTIFLDPDGASDNHDDLAKTLYSLVCLAYRTYQPASLQRRFGYIHWALRSPWSPQFFQPVLYQLGERVSTSFYPVLPIQGTRGQIQKRGHSLACSPHPLIRKF